VASTIRVTTIQASNETSTAIPRVSLGVATYIAADVTLAITGAISIAGAISITNTIRVAPISITMNSRIGVAITLRC